MTHDERCCQVLLLPTREVAATNLSESEAAAWARGYNDARVSETRQAIPAGGRRVARSVGRRPPAHAARSA